MRMNNKEWQRRVAYEVLVILGMLALFTFICRLWPILLLIILGIFIAAIRLLFLSSRQVTATAPLPLQTEPPKEPTEQDVRTMAYAVILRRVTDLVLSEFPEARWVWESANAKKQIESSEEVYILLNRAGGYRRARVRIVNLQVTGIEYQTAPAQENPASESAEEEPDAEPESGETEPMPENYELLAFEWVEANMMDLNSRCNEAIGLGQSELILSADELPVRESWPDICRELNRNDLDDVQCIPEGIRINLEQ